VTHRRGSDIHASGSARDAALAEERVESQEEVRIGGLHGLHVPCSHVSLDSLGGRIVHVRDYTDALRVARGMGRLPQLVAALE
jgi:hypothetical protein